MFLIKCIHTSEILNYSSKKCMNYFYELFGMIFCSWSLDCMSVLLKKKSPFMFCSREERRYTGLDCGITWILWLLENSKFSETAHKHAPWLKTSSPTHKWLLLMCTTRHLNYHSYTHSSSEKTFNYHIWVHAHNELDWTRERDLTC